LGVETVIGPATGGVPLAYATAHGLHDYTQVWPNLTWADKDGEGFVVERDGFVAALRGKRVLLVEDLPTTGETITKVRLEAERYGAQIVGMSLICNRSGLTADGMGVPHLYSVFEVELDSYEAAACPLCAQREPIVRDIGHGATYQVEHPDYKGGYIELLAA
jgi:orotate phosphoribosyltransferase